MNELKKNKKTIFICFCLIIFILICYFGYYYLFSNKDNSVDEIEIKKHYDINEINYKYVLENDVVKIYYNEFRNDMLFDRNEAYNLLNEDYRNERFGSLEEFNNYLDGFVSEALYSNSVDKYSVNYVNGKKVFNIIDDSGNQYIIKENSIMNYEVYLDEYTVIIN